jgi:hypothetical protein
MLKMKVDPDISMKTKDRENLRQVDPDMLMRGKKLRDNQGEARTLLKGKAVIALFATEPHKFLRISLVRRMTRLIRCPSDRSVRIVRPAEKSRATNLRCCRACNMICTEDAE